ncbi:hypothetical protein DFR24_1962 [Panacagrimonas perspica]|uniref:Uncharacterized protein n=1 Tax=Panacagrimonas perspica TaxID=381431 RepID=A0A4R7PED3_9GAMM|nr:hypothetical protein [Panacagrimonas perspica]TDU32564.1 hypothetical protein DFR24_1962 [Panacagrimonas perspica]THD05464.1 hypothetical protein B1810_01690 [Panacagrimonas perspica]
MSEVIVNLWAIYDAGSRVVYALAGRCYEMEGTEPQKLALLKALSRHDHRNAKRYPVPKRFAIHYGDGVRKEGVTYLNAISDPNVNLFEEVTGLGEKRIREQLAPKLLLE